VSLTDTETLKVSVPVDPINHRHLNFLGKRFILYTDTETLIFSDKGLYTDIDTLLHLDIDIDRLLKVSMSTQSLHFLDIGPYIEFC